MGSVKQINPSNSSLKIDTTILNENAQALLEIDRAARDLTDDKLTRNSKITIPEHSAFKAPL